MTSPQASPEEHVTVRFRLRDSDELPPTEGLWAQPVDAHDGGGSYRLTNNGFYVPVAVGDLVRAELNGDSQLQVVELLAPAPRILTYATRSGSDDEVAAMGDRWRDAGAIYTEGTVSVLATVWGDDMGLDAIAVVMRPDVARGAITWADTFLPDERLGDWADLVLELDTVEHAPPVATSYWAADDPWWQEHGLGDVDTLSYVQHLASVDPRVARALEKGQQSRVLTYMERINAPDPSVLPPLDGPLFDEED